MTITKNLDGATLTLALEGRLDTTTTPQLESEVRSSLTGVTELRLDFTALEYISSAGLRVVLAAQKIMNQQGRMVVLNPNEYVMEVLEVTGFSDVLTIE